jgi:cytochrome b561
LLLGLVIPAGIWIRYFEPADQVLKLRLYNIHESLGVIVFLIALLRLLIRWRHPPPPLPPDTPRLIRLAARCTHLSMYALLIFMPISGFLATNAWGFPLAVFNLISLPSPVGKNETLAVALSFSHWCGAIAMGTLIGAHLLGAAYHRFFARDGLTRRMI